MITQCPSCHTHFRVHTEQLAKRAGQVRCGNAAGYFDALEYLIEEDRAGAEIARGARNAAVRADAAAADAWPAKPAESAPVAANLNEESNRKSRQALTPKRETGTSGRNTPGWQLPSTMPAQAASVEARRAERKLFRFRADRGRGPGKTHAALALAAGALLFLLLVLFGQAAFQYRSALIVLFPEAKPYAAELCAALGVANCRCRGASR